MKWNRGCIAGILLGAGLFAGCAQTKALQTKALAPTEQEARSIAQAQLDQQADALKADSHGKGDGYQLTGSPHFTTKVLPQPGGGAVYEVTATQQASRSL